MHYLTPIFLSQHEKKLPLTLYSHSFRVQLISSTEWHESLFSPLDADRPLREYKPLLPHVLYAQVTVLIGEINFFNIVKEEAGSILWLEIVKGPLNISFNGLSFYSVINSWKIEDYTPHAILTNSSKCKTLKSRCSRKYETMSALK